MPNTVSEAMMDPDGRQPHNKRPMMNQFRYEPADQSSPRDMHDPLHLQSSRPPMPFRSQSSEPTSGYAARETKRVQPSPQHLHQGSYGDVFDSYYHSPHYGNTNSMHQEVNYPHALPEYDMPNFDNVSETKVGHQREMTIDAHLHPQQRAPTLPPMPPQSHSRPLDSAQPNPRSGQGFSRSKSSPNLQEQGPQRSQQYSDGFNFELPGAVPAMYTPAPPPRFDDSNSNHFSKEPYQPPRSGWRQDNIEQLEHLPQMSPHPHQHISRPGTSESHVRQPILRSSDGQRQPPMPRDGPAYNSQSRGPRNGPSPIKDVGPTSPPVSSRSNPDALPSHPPPVRAGLMQGTPLNQPSRPPPVRQYSEGPSSRPDTSSSQKPQISRPPSKEDKSIAVTHQELERLRQVARSDPSNNQTQLLLAKKLVEAASVLADEGGRADTKTRSRNCERFMSEAYKLVKKLVHSGYPEAMFFLGDCYSRGSLGLEIDPKEAFGHYQTAAKLGHAQAAYRVAVCCEMGLDEGGGTKRDALKAIQWYQRAATLGDPPAMYKMGVIQLKGLLGQAKNPKAALTWLQGAAERADKENPHALHELGLLYEASNGPEGLSKDEAHAKQLFTEAANLGYKFSQFRLGCAYEYGLLECSIDPRQSIAWYSKAAVQDEHQSELALSGWYLTGSEGVLQQSDTEAYLWARKAAQAGLAKAEYAMGYFTEVGIGAPANIEDAKRWYWRAASQNYPKARERLEDLRRGGAKMQKTRVSRSKINKQSEGECVVM
ncbi:MAG: hypothetical protein Q9179_003664 [Wetmoreana sp. 5 TL-2023]